MDTQSFAIRLIIGSILLAWLWRTRGLNSASTPTLALCLLLIIKRIAGE